MPGRWSSLLPSRYRKDRAADPGTRLGTASARRRLSLYLALLQVGFASTPCHHGAWCALTAPFHPCLPQPGRGGGLLSVALSVALRRLGVTQHPAQWESGLSSPTLSGRPPGPLDHVQYNRPSAAYPHRMHSEARVQRRGVARPPSASRPPGIRGASIGRTKGCGRDAWRDKLLTAAPRLSRRPSASRSPPWHATSPGARGRPCPPTNNAACRAPPA